MLELDSFGNFTASGNAEISMAWLLKAIKNHYHPADKKLEEFLLQVGRRKFLTPLYGELAKTEEGKSRAKAIYARARPNYHYVARNTLDNLLK